MVSVRQLKYLKNCFVLDSSQIYTVITQSEHEKYRKVIELKNMQTLYYETKWNHKKTY